MPFSIRFFWIAILLGILSIIPYSGIIILMFLTQYWLAIILNIGLLGIFSESVFGYVHKIWILVPITVYGAYAGIVFEDRRDVEALRQEILSENSGPILKFDPEIDAAVFTQFDQINDRDAYLIARNFQIKSVYKKISIENDSLYRIYRFGNKEQCQELRKKLSGSNNVSFGALNYIEREISHTNYTDRESLYDSFCILYTPGPLLGLPFKISVSSKSEYFKGHPKNITLYHIKSPEGNHITRKSIIVQQLSWIPRPVLFFSFSKYRHGLPLEFNFLREPVRLDLPIDNNDSGGEAPDHPIAQALGLKKATIEFHLMRARALPASKATQ